MSDAKNHTKVYKDRKGKKMNGWTCITHLPDTHHCYESLRAQYPGLKLIFLFFFFCIYLKAKPVEECYIMLEVINAIQLNKYL